MAEDKYKLSRVLHLSTQNTDQNIDNAVVSRNIFKRFLRLKILRYNVLLQ